jgi:hypothetical protein
MLMKRCTKASGTEAIPSTMNRRAASCQSTFPSAFHTEKRTSGRSTGANGPRRRGNQKRNRRSQCGGPWRGRSSCLYASMAGITTAQMATGRHHHSRAGIPVG